MMNHKDTRGYTGFFACNCDEHAYHSNCCDCHCTPYVMLKNNAHKLKVGEIVICGDPESKHYSVTSVTKRDDNYD